jgi:hypothetical protein
MEQIRMATSAVGPLHLLLWSLHPPALLCCALSVPLLHLDLDLIRLTLVLTDLAGETNKVRISSNNSGLDMSNRKHQYYTGEAG